VIGYLDVTIQAAIDRRAGLAPSPRVYEALNGRNRDLSVLVLLAISESTKDFVKGSSMMILTVERIPGLVRLGRCLCGGRLLLQRPR